MIVINKGELIADDSPDNLSKTMSAGSSLTLRIDGPEDDVCALLAGIDGVSRADKLGAREESAYDFVVEMESGKDIRREIFRALAKRDWPLLGMRGNELTLEEIFIQLTNSPENSEIADTEAGDTVQQTEQQGGDDR